MVYFTDIAKDSHYIEYHEREVPWNEAVQVILTSKNKRKKGNKIEIETTRYYLLCEVRETTLYVINAKRNR